MASCRPRCGAYLGGRSEHRDGLFLWMEGQVAVVTETAEPTSSPSRTTPSLPFECLAELANTLCRVSVSH